MIQHKCGTCRYFEEGGFAGSGRCGHPLRKNIQQMVLVRKSELACRTDWANDLWEGKSEIEPLPITSSPRFSPDSRERDANREYTDRVTAVSVTMPQHGASDTGSSLDQFPTHRHPVETPRESTSHSPEPGRAQPEPRRTIAPKSEPPHQQPEFRAPVVQRRDQPVSHPASSGTPASATWPERPRTSLTDQNQDFEVPRAAPREDHTGDRRTSLPSYGRSASPAAPFNAASQGPVPTPKTVNRPVQSEQREARGSDRVPGVQRNGQAIVAPFSPAPTAPTFGAMPGVAATDDVLSQGRSGWTEPFEVAPPTTAAPNAPAPAARTGIPPEEVAVKAQPSGASRSPGTVNQPAIRECCGTCRDFRPAEGGERGWCNNPYAFDHRRMVERNELACRGTIGSWWIASDDWWLQRADIAHHGRPTPIVDDLLRKLLDARAFGAGRRSGRV